MNRLWVASDVKVRKDFANDPQRRRAGVGEDIVDENFDDGGAQDEADSSQAGAEDNDFDSEDSHSEGESFLQTKMAPKSRSF